MADDRLTLFFQQFDQLLLLGNQGINFDGFMVEEVGDLDLFFFLVSQYRNIVKKAGHTKYHNVYPNPVVWVQN